ncbi:glutaredoxin 2 [Paraglaciecola mesophila KMM 241]|uniref:Glutaredoxin 2 n=1 Tax=Paraglaciecola mesophila KMM 241 TaxID=1128912 RepID=K6Y025_9ALTE|nr:glutaredoxin 2 [Paraglaciecola mesophila]GAC26189.1 glutaredoxin 2 [Paraglaciecola mesophila KMM 241]
MSTMHLYIYDHCPYCVMARMPFAMKNIPVELTVLPNDDETTPISMIGVKACPILKKPDGSFMPESMEIVSYIDQLDNNPIFSPSANRADLSAWFKDVNLLMKQLLYPRWITSPVKEFQTQNAIDYFTHKKSKELGSFTDALANSEQLIKALEIQLEKLATILHSETSVNEQLSFDDITLFGRLRGITLIKGLTIPAKISVYLDYFSTTCDIPLFYDAAQ